MNRLDACIEKLRTEGRKALVAFITAGYPDMATTLELVDLLSDNGVDIVELGVPFSDPVADGPTIQFSSDAALKGGASLGGILRLTADIRKRNDVPIVLMSYYNPVIHGGIDRTLKKAARSGVDGFIIPDLIPEEGAAVKHQFERNGLSLVYLTAPNTPPKRMEYIDRESSSFVYLVSVAGVTGGRTGLPESIRQYLARTSRHIRRNPRFVGFGISGPEQVRRLKGQVDGVIVGSAIIDLIRKHEVRDDRNRAVASFVSSLRAALDE